MSATTEKTTKTPRAQKRIPLTAEEEARQRAALVLDLRQKRDELEMRIKTEEDYLRQYVEHSGQKELGALTAIRRANPVQLVGDGLTDKETEYAREQLMNELPDFTKRSLDLGKMYAALATNTVVVNALTAKGLGLLQTSGWTFRKA